MKSFSWIDASFIYRLAATTVLAALATISQKRADAQQLVVDFRFDGQTGAAATTQTIGGLPGQTYTIDIWATVVPPSPTANSNLGLMSFGMRGASDITVGGGAFATGAGIGVAANPPGSFVQLTPFNPAGFTQPKVSDLGSTTNNGTSITSNTPDGILDFGGTLATSKLTILSNTGGLTFGGGSTGQPNPSGGWEWEVGQFNFRTGAATPFSGATTLFVPLQLSSGTATAATISTNGATAVSVPITVGSSLTFVTGPPPGTWTGLNSSTWADNGNWIGGTPGATAGTTNMDTANFNRNAPNSPLTIDAGRNLKNITFDTAGVNSLTIGTIGGNALLLTAGGTIQTNSSVVNPQTINAPLVLEGDYSFTCGASNISATLSFGGGITPGATNGIATLTLNGGNAGANTISGVLADNGSGQLAVTKSGTGLWVLGGANTYSGATTINAGTLVLANSAAVRNSTVTLNVNGLAFAAGLGSATLGGLAGTGSLALEDQASTPAAVNVSIGGNGASTIYSGTLSGSGGLTKVGAGTLTLSGFNTFTGGLLVSGGIVKLDAPGSFAVSQTCPVTVGSGAELDVNQTNNVSDSPMTVNGVVNITGGGHQHFNLLSLNGATIETSGSSFSDDGQGNYSLDNSTTNVGGTMHSTLAASIGVQLNASSTFNVASTGDPAGDLVVSATLRNAENGATAALTKTGPGTMVLTANSTYSGLTTISAGTLTTTATGSIGSGPLVVSAADTFSSTLNLGANQTVSSLSGTLAGSGTARLNVASLVTLTVDQPANTTYGGALGLAAGVVAGRGGALVKSSGGTLEIQSSSSFANNSFLEISGGALRFNVGSGSASVGTGAVALIGNGAILELAGSVSALSSGGSGKHAVSILNNSTAVAGILVSGTDQQVGGIDGSGTTQINAGSDLTANHIIQSALVIGGTAISRTLVTIDASDAYGYSLAGDLSLADSLTPAGPFGAGISSASTTGGSAKSDSSSDALAPLIGNLSVRAGAPAVPEPSSMILLAIGGLGLAGRAIVRRARVHRAHE